MRVCLLASPAVSVPPLSYGGTEAVLDILARGLEAAGHDVLLIATGDSTCPVDKAWCFPEAVGVGLGGPGVELRQATHGYRAAATWGADIVHDHTVIGPLYARDVAELPVVTTNHGPFDAPDLGPYYRAISGRVPIIAISHHQASRALGTSIAAVIHHGVDLERFPEGTGTGGYAMFLGRMHPDKGVDVAARVARAAGVPLRIAAKMSEPQEVAYFEAEVQPLLGDGVEYLGEIGFAEKVRLLGQATCLLNPIRWAEPFGMVMVEAMACGTPIVGTPWGSIPELVDEGVTGHLRTTEDALADALLAADQLDRTACRESVRSRFSAERMVAGHVALYERLVAEGAPGDLEGTAV